MVVTESRNSPMSAIFWTDPRHDHCRFHREAVARQIWTAIRTLIGWSHNFPRSFDDCPSPEIPDVRVRVCHFSYPSKINL